MAEAVKDALDQAAGLPGSDDLDETDADLIAESLLNLEEDSAGEQEPEPDSEDLTADIPEDDT